MITVAVTGGYATGKTLAVKMFSKYSAEVLYADKIAHKVMMPNTSVYKDIVELFGKVILRKNRKINRHKLARIIFADKKKLKKLESIVHPKVKEELKRIIRKKFVKGQTRMLIIEIPLLFEAGMQSWFTAANAPVMSGDATSAVLAPTFVGASVDPKDRTLTKIIVVSCKRGAQYERAKKRDKLRIKEIEQRINSQWPLYKKEKKADFVVDNSGSVEETKRQVLIIWKELVSLSKEKGGLAE